MSVLYSTDTGFFISHAKFIDVCYSQVHENSTEVGYKLKSELFKIYTPYKTSDKLLSKQRKRYVYQSDENHNKLQEEVSLISQ